MVEHYILQKIAQPIFNTHYYFKIARAQKAAEQFILEMIVLVILIAMKLFFTIMKQNQMGEQFIYRQTIIC